MGNSTSHNAKYEAANSKLQPSHGQKKIEGNIRRFAEFLESQSGEGEVTGISTPIITTHLCNGNSRLGECLFRQFMRNSGACTAGSELPGELPGKLPDKLPVDQFVAGSSDFLSLITDEEQLTFFINGFSDGSQIERSQVQHLVVASYQISHLHSPDICPQLTTAVVDAVMHNKPSVGVGYMRKWCLQNCHRLVYWMHRHIVAIIISSVRETLTKEVPINSIKKGSTAAKKDFKDSAKWVADGSSGKKAVLLKATSVIESSMVAEALSEPITKSSSIHGLAESSNATNVSKPHSLDLEQTSTIVQDEAATDTPVLERAESIQSCLTPSLIWLLTSSLPLIYTKQPHQQQTSPDGRRPSLPVITAIHSMIQNSQPNHWEPLYISERDGLGMNRFEHHVFNYRGPTLTFFTTTDENVIFCLVLDCEWKDSKNFWGGEDCRLLQIMPQFKILERGEKLMYFNLNWRGFPTGIQVGNDYESRALCVNSELSQLQHHNVPYKLASVEVWGCGARLIRENQREFRKRQTQDVEQRRKVKISSSDWLEHPDRYLLQMAGGKTSYVSNVTNKPSQ